MGLLWGFPFFVHAEHRTEAEAGGLLSLLVVVFMVGGPLIGGFIARHPWQRSTVVLGIVGRDGAHLDRGAAAGPATRRSGCSCLLVVTTGLGGPGSMIGFDLARTFAPASRLGQASGIVNVGGFAASLLVVLGIGLVLDAVTPGASTDYSAARLHAGRCACSTSAGCSAGCRCGATAGAPARTSRDTQPETFRTMSGLEDVPRQPTRPRAR